MAVYLISNCQSWRDIVYSYLCSRLEANKLLGCRLSQNNNPADRRSL